MKRFQHGLMGRLACAASLLALAAGSSGCDRAQAKSEAEPVAVQSQAQLQDLAEQCGLDINCEFGGLAEGRATISGVASVDGFFASVLKFETTALSVAGGIDAELEAIRADFGLEASADIAAEIMAQASLHTEAGLEIEVEPAQCRVDAQASIMAQAECDAEFDPGSAMVKCEGSCEVEASANVECGADVSVMCTVKAPSVECSGSCKGSCTVDVAAGASCSGTCNGTCDGECSFMNTDGQWEGECSGTCEGSCTTEFNAEASCDGTCEGECTAEAPDGNCEGGIRASCEGSASAMVDCQGSCDGNVEPPMASAECNASAKANASFNMECTPPSIDVRYQLAVGANVDVEAQARFVAAVENLKVRLPALKAKLKKANLVVEAGAELAGSATAGVQGVVQGAIDGDFTVAQTIGLQCALGELEAVGGIIGNASGRIDASVSAVGSLATLGS